jgi:DNA-3-methyladenine glycosylase I
MGDLLGWGHPSEAHGHALGDLCCVLSIRAASSRRVSGGFGQSAAGIAKSRKVARYDRRKIAALLADAGIVRNRAKVESAIKNATAFLDVQAEFGSFDAYQWRFVDGRPIQNRRRAVGDIPARTAQSDAMSKDLKSRGFTFVGSTIIYAHMQAVGMVNDHVVDCFRHREVAQLGRR